jgi:CubicO group peptidase (beta-lactamase class C family)
MRRDAIFRIYHMTMTVTAAAVMQLVEDGAIRLDDPVEQYLPAFRKMTVFDAGSERPAKRPITIHQLLTHTSGLIYPTPADAIGQRYMDAKIWDAKDLDAFCAQIATLPLSFDPGERWRYGVSYDVLGALVEKVSGKPFETFLQERLFEPLGMLDTGFVAPEAKRTRVVDCSARRAPLIAPNAGEYHGGKGERITAIASGGLGLYSTVDDYLRFAQMLLNGGELDGRRVLGRKTVELMMRNHLNRLDPPTMSSDHREGFGLGGSVRLNATSSGSLGSDGSFGWSGYASTFYTIDPSEDMIVMLFRWIREDCTKRSSTWPSARWWTSLEREKPRVPSGARLQRPRPVPRTEAARLEPENENPTLILSTGLPRGARSQSHFNPKRELRPAPA